MTDDERLMNRANMYARHMLQNADAETKADPQWDILVRMLAHAFVTGWASALEEKERYPRGRR